MTRAQFRSMCGARKTPESEKIYLPTKVLDNIPEEFDAIKEWPSCETIGTIYDQGHCGSCWAMASFESLQDRFCIHSNGSMKPLLSGQHLTSCCPGSNGCNGGWQSKAFNFIKGNGITTEECIPYQMGTCKHPGCSMWKTPKCNRTCYPNTKIPVDKEKYYVRTYGNIARKEAAIQTEIMTNGPVTGSFTVYQDFATYKSGVYHHVSGGYDGLHAIKIVGWGVQDGVKYWKVVNSWNTDWGMDGVFLIKRGNNECGIEGDIVVALPKI
eukprot:MONOS_2202.1-p1 / transcript=MONOS_2202.1 / gene=MONOS_2202 / organism=Monocercomonoides_exilis_PA203 / gene_product=cathepsin B / transcript_product=cathepsin B / location=Mono_scaffold00043:180746-181549(-) / protein_length=267 / sequence_SO=supercontig / SO=protein_coding / is_pseudo=false